MPLSEPSSVRRLPFKFLQANVRGAYDTQRCLLEHGIRTEHWDLLLIQEASRSTDALVERAYGYALVRRSELRELPGRNISTCIYARMESVHGIPEYVPLQEDDCSCSGEARESHIEHICTVAYDLPDGSRFYVTNIYNRISEDLPEDCLTAHLQYDGHLFDAGDFNMHHGDWDSDLMKAPSRTEPLTVRYKDEVMRRGLQLLTHTRGVPTWRSGDRYSIVDLAWATADLDCLPVKLREDLNLPSDHIGIESTGSVIADPQPICVLDWNKADNDGLANALKTYVKEVKYLPLDTVSHVRERTKDFVSRLQMIIAEFVPSVSRSSRLRFNVDSDEIQELTKQVKVASAERDEAHVRARRMHMSVGYRRNRRKVIFAPYLAKERKVTRLNVLLRQLQDIELSRQVRSSYGNASKWRVYGNAKRKGRPRAPVTVPHLRVKDIHGNFVGHTTNAHEKVSVLRLDWYGHLRPEEEAEEATCTIEERSESMGPSSPSQKVSKSDLKIIVKKLKERKAAGQDGIGPRFIKNFGEHFMTYLARLWSACLRLAYFPEVFQIGLTIPIPKALSLDAIYDLPNLFRPICLLSTLGKTLESILADTLATLARAKNLLPATQMAARGRSTTTALLYIVGVIMMARLNGLAVSVMGLDQKGAYNAVLFSELERVFRAKCVPEWIIAMVSSFLSGRWTTIRIPGFESEPMRCGGVPQGSPLSSILFAFFTSRLLEIKEFPHERGRVFKLAFSDDTYIIVIGISVSEIKPVLAHQYRLCQTWAKESGASFGSHKTKVIHFASPAQNDDRNRMSHYIEDFNDKLEYDCTTTGKDHFMTILGVRFAVDSRGNLTWAAHWDRLEERFTELVKDFSRIAKSTWGLSIEDALNVYKTGHRAALLSGSIVWSEPCDEPWYLGKPRDHYHPRDPKDDTDDSGNYIGDSSLQPYFTPNSVRVKRQNRLREMGDKFDRMTIGSFARAPRWYRRAEISNQPLDLYCYHTNVTTLANMMGTPEWDTIESAKKRVQDYADSMDRQNTQTLRRGRVRDFGERKCSLETQASEWRKEAEEDIRTRERTKALEKRKRKRPSSEDDSDDDNHNHNDAEEPISQLGADALAQFQEAMDIHPNAHDANYRDEPSRHRLKLRLKALSKVWSDRRVEMHYEYWRRKKFNAFVTNHPNRPIPAALETEWSKNNINRYKGLTRPLDYLLFGLRTEYIGLLQHRRELCGSDIDDSHCRLCRATKGNGNLETITHLLHYCSALKEEQLELQREVFRTCPSIKNYDDLRRDIIKLAPELVARFALEHFPIDQLEWTRRNMLDLILNPDEGND